MRIYYSFNYIYNIHLFIGYTELQNLVNQYKNTEQVNIATLQEANDLLIAHRKYIEEQIEKLYKKVLEDARSELQYISIANTYIYTYIHKNIQKG